MSTLNVNAMETMMDDDGMRRWDEELGKEEVQ